jgi:hypothetical protein
VTLLDLIVTLVVLVLSRFIPMPWGVVLTVVVSLIVERLLRGERL